MPRADRPRVGYVLKMYPRLSETFIVNEILAHEAAGLRLEIFSLRAPVDSRFHETLGRVRAPVTYIPYHRFRASELWKSIQSAARRMPAVWDALRDASDAAAADVCQAIHLAMLVRERRIDHLHAHFMTVAAHTAHVVHLLTGLPYTVTAHAKDVYRTTVDWDLAAVVARHAKAVITVCDANLRYLAHRLDGSGAQLVRIYNGLGPQDPPAGTDARTAGLVLGV